MEGRTVPYGFSTIAAHATSGVQGSPILWLFSVLGGIIMCKMFARVILFVFFFYHMYTHFHQVKQIYPMGFYSTLIVPQVLALMNLLWFWKIVKGMIKTLTKLGEHTHSN